MDGREKLRRYLEQRRDLGERELVLDGMSVHEVMRIVGAVGGAQTSGEPASAEPASSAPTAHGPADAAPARPTRARDTTTPDAPRPAGDEPPTDWRAILRASGAAPDSPDSPDSPGSPASTESTDSPAAPESTRREDAVTPRARQRAAAEPAERERMAEPEEAMATKRKFAAASDSGPIAKEEAAAPAWLADLGVEVGLRVGDARSTVPDIAKLPSLEAVANAVERCTRCPLYATATRAVPGEGKSTADFICVGEAPGASEDETGRPFVGAAGQLLTKILEAIKLSREDVFICNVLKHRPPGNRNPTPDEVEACSPYLLRQLELLKPKVIVTFGAFASQTLLETKTPIGKLRGHVHFYHGVPLVVTYHPAALLRNSAWKRPTWEDVKLARRILDRASGA